MRIRDKNIIIGNFIFSIKWAYRYKNLKTWYKIKEEDYYRCINVKLKYDFLLRLESIIIMSESNIELKILIYYINFNP